MTKLTEVLPWAIFLPADLLINYCSVTSTGKTLIHSREAVENSHNAYVLSRDTGQCWDRELTPPKKSVSETCLCICTDVESCTHSSSSVFPIPACTGGVSTEFLFTQTEGSVWAWWTCGGFRSVSAVDSVHPKPDHTQDEGSYNTYLFTHSLFSIPHIRVYVNEW